MMASRARLDGIKYVTPLHQGDLSNLCGLYSVLNAVQLACWRFPPTNEQLRDLLKFGFRYLSKRRLLARVVAFGMDQDVWTELGTALIDYSNELLSTSLALQPLPLRSGPPKPDSAPEAVRILKGTLFEGHPILCGFGGALDHYTVLSGYSAQRLTLFDSSGFHWIDQRSIGSSERSGKRHWLYADSARAVVDTW
jgi:hypothetical protein